MKFTVFEDVTLYFVTKFTDGLQETHMSVFRSNTLTRVYRNLLSHSPLDLNHVRIIREKASLNVLQIHRHFGGIPCLRVWPEDRGKGVLLKSVNCYSPRWNNVPEDGDNRSHRFEDLGC
jgi:hypothetical protein